MPGIVELPTEEDLEDEGEGSQPGGGRAWAAGQGGVSKKMQPPGRSLGQLVGIFAPGSYLSLGERLVPGRQDLRRLSLSRKACTRVCARAVLEAEAWTVGRMVQVSYVHSSRRLVLPQDKATLLLTLGLPLWSFA